MIGAIVLVVLALIYGIFKYAKKEDSTAVVTPEDQTVNTPTYSYKNGTYSSNGKYVSPGGAEEIGVTLVLKNDVIEDVTVQTLATQPVSVKLQKVFADNYKPLVVGKKIDNVTLDKVSGSSLTPKGWNDAIAKIKVQASI